jgi:alkylated DNA nucleotide flippase Atl1
MLATFDGPLPAPDDSPGEVQWLDLGAAWGDVGKAAGTDDPRQIAGIVRAILARPQPAPVWTVMAASARNHGRGKKDAKEA